MGLARTYAVPEELVGGEAGREERGSDTRGLVYYTKGFEPKEERQPE